METVTYIAHHGILGQKWGVRRYQRKDGTLTRAGQKRYADAKAFVNRVDGTAPPPKPRPKKISEMTDEELSVRISRMTAEKQAYGLEADINRYVNPPKAPSVVDNFKKELATVLIDSAKKAAPDIMKAVVSAAFGIKIPDKNDKNNNQNNNQNKNGKEISPDKARAQALEDKIHLMEKEDAYNKRLKAREEAQKAEKQAKKEERKAKKEAEKKAKQETVRAILGESGSTPMPTAPVSDPGYWEMYARNRIYYM